MPLDKLWALHQSVASILALRLEIQSKRDPSVISKPLRFIVGPRRASLPGWGQAPALCEDSRGHNKAARRVKESEHVRALGSHQATEELRVTRPETTSSSHRRPRAMALTRRAS